MICPAGICHRHPSRGPLGRLEICDSVGFSNHQIDEILHFSRRLSGCVQDDNEALIIAAFLVQSLDIDYYNAVYRRILPERRNKERKEAINAICRAFSKPACHPDEEVFFPTRKDLVDPGAYKKGKNRLLNHQSNRQVAAIAAKKNNLTL